MTSRRRFLAGLAAMALPCPSWADVGSPAFLAAAKTAEGFALHGLGAGGDSLFALPLPARGHAVAAHPTRALAVAFARRPGTFALVIDCASGQEIHRLTPPDGRQFNGHGAFSGDGALLYTSEVVAETSEGRIGIWDCAGFVRRGEWASGGIGPHDIKGMADGSLVVANGGIATDPDDRSKLNLPSMHPNLTQLSAGGEILAQASLAPDLLQNSIRHLALLPDGRIAFAMQWEGDPAEIVPLLGLWTPGAAPVLCAAPEGEAPRMKGYAGSVAATAEGTLAMTSPKGGVAQLFDAFGTFLATVPRADVCGIAALDADSFLASDGSGSLMRLTPAGPQVLMQGVVAWDNHIVRIAPVA